jgi:sarcosine oxidase
VIGAGLLGLAAAWSLSRRGWRVTVVEAARAAGHVRSGSKGSARIFRFGYPDPLYVDMARSAEPLWRDLERTSGRRLLSQTGQVTLGGVAVLDAITSAMEGAGLEVHALTADEAERRIPDVTVRGPVLFEPHSGVLRADACLDAFRASGDFEVRSGLGLVTLDHRGTGGVVVRGAETTLTADVAVVCAGPHTFDLLGLRPPVAAPASFPQVAYFVPREGRARPPVFIEWGDDMLYGLPVPGGPSGPPLFKVSQHAAGEPAERFDPTDPSPLPDDAAGLDLLRDGVGRLLPGLDPVPVATERCVYDNSADTDFVLDRAGPVVVGCGTSGHAFKFGPYLGELLADLAEGTEPPFVRDRFGLSRIVPPPAPAADPAAPGSPS